ncbi:MAG: hypothetical protein JWP75_3887 [Frondihabitans sp.]|nr:hypothetical protein [Frondihabitans sp.]
MRRARAKDLATFVVHLGVSPTDYWALTITEHAAIVKEFNATRRR